MHEPNIITLAAKASGEPQFRTIGLGPWNQEHPEEARPDDESSARYDVRFDSRLLDEGDQRNVLDRYRYWSVEAIRDDLDKQGRFPYEVAIENWTHDFNIGSIVRTANALSARRVTIVGPHKWNRKGSLMTELYQYVDYQPHMTAAVQAWRERLAKENHDIRSTVARIERVLRSVEGDGDVQITNNTKTCLTTDEADRDVTTVSNATRHVDSGVECDVDSSFDSLDRDIESIEGAYGLAITLALDVMRRYMMRLPASISRETIETVSAMGWRTSDLSDIANCLLDYLRQEERDIEQAKVIALDIMPGAQPIECYQFPRRCLLLFGAEGPGLTQTALSFASDIVFISQFGSVRSLNAGAAAAVSMHAWMMQHAHITNS